MGKWFIGKIKYTFWSLVVSAALMVATSFSPKSQHKLLEAIQLLSKKVKSATPQAMLDQLPVEVNPKSELLPVAAETEGQRQISSSSNEYVVDDKNYVLIGGKYYQARADNKYMINGKQVYYVNNRRLTEQLKQLEIEKMQKAKLEEMEASGDSGLPVSPDEMMQTLKKGQKAAQERNRVLKEIENE